MTSTANPRILVVDDSPVERLFAGRLLANELSAVVSYATNGMDALHLAMQASPDLVVTDLQMPLVNGLELVKSLKTLFPDLPVILMTGVGNEEIAIQALQSGAASYVPKRFLSNRLAKTVSDLLTLSNARQSRRRILGCISHSETRFHLPNDPALISPMIEFVQEAVAHSNLFTSSFIVQLGVVLQEAIANAINHGNLEVSSDLRQDDEAVFVGAIQRRRYEEPYASRRVEISVSISCKQGVQITVRDEGPGFDVASVLDPTADLNLDRIGGRGLLLMRTFMDEVVHNSRGNEVTMLKYAQLTNHSNTSPAVVNGRMPVMCSGRKRGEVHY